MHRVTSGKEEDHPSSEDQPCDLPQFELAIVCKKAVPAERGDGTLAELDAAGVLEQALVAAGLLVERVEGMSFETFLKVGAPEAVLGRAAEHLRIKKATILGMEAVFRWAQRELFVRQPSGQLFTWTERYHCLDALLHTAKGERKEALPIRVPSEMGRVDVPPDVSLLPFLQERELIKEVFPLHVEAVRRRLLRTWSLAWFSLGQPVDEIHAYFGAKVATYFAFLGMYTNWLWGIALVGFYLYARNWGSYHVAVPPAFGVLVVVWGVLFLQFWKRRNTELMERWEIRKEDDEVNRQEYKWRADGEEEPLDEASLLASLRDLRPTWAGREEEWRERLGGVGSNLVALLGVVLVQLPLEAAYHHGLHSFAHRQVWQYALTAMYVVVVGQLTTAGGKLGMWLNRRQTFVSTEAASDALVYKVFGIYFVQSFFGLAYTAVVHRDFAKLRSFLLRRLLVAQVMDNVSESLVPFLTYRYNRFKAFRAEQYSKRKVGEKARKHDPSDVERQYLMPPYVASIGDGRYDGIFNDFLELALQFGMVTMFACCFPLVGVFSLLNNLVEIRSDSFKLLSMLRRPIPHKVASIGSWFTIFQQVGVLAIVSNCVLVVYMYDEGKLQMDPALLLVLLMEHALLLTRYGLAWLIPEEPAWVKEKRFKREKIREHFSAEVLQAFVSKRASTSQSQSRETRR